MWSGCFWKRIFKEAVVSLWESVLGAAARPGTPESWEQFPLIVFHGCADITLPLSVSTDVGAVLPLLVHHQQEDHLTLDLPFLITKKILLVLWLHPQLVVSNVRVFVSCSVFSKAFHFIETAFLWDLHVTDSSLWWMVLSGSFTTKLLSEISNCFVWLVWN